MNAKVVLAGRVMALLMAIGTTDASAGTLVVSSYNMINGNGQAVGGEFNYWDGTYNGTGAKTTDNAPLSGGTGALTNGVIATDIWSNVSNDSGTGEYVGWYTPVSGNPVITFHFAGNPTVDDVELYVDNSDIGGVGAPGSITIDGTNYNPVVTAISTYAEELTVSGLSLPGNGITVQPIAGIEPWIFVSEVQFSGVPEPATWTLLLVGLVGLGAAMRTRRGQRSSWEELVTQHASKPLAPRWRCVRLWRFGSAVLFAPMLWGSTAQAAIVTFVGQDEGPLTCGTSSCGPFPNSDAAQTNFENAAAAYGILNTITYEALATGFYSPIAAAPGVSITLNAPNGGPGFSGISNFTYGYLNGFNTTPGGSQWLGFPNSQGSPIGSATFTFATPTHSFGTFLTGLQADASDTNDLRITFNDGTAEVLTPPINMQGGAEYFGFTDTTAISSITLDDSLSTFDDWGIDDTTFNMPVPEPSTLALLGAGLGGLFACRSRARRRLRAEDA